MAKKAISVIERRLQGKSALHATSQPIPLKDKRYTLLWGNADISDNQIWHLVNNLGWEYVVPEDIACTLEEMGASQRDNRIVRGPRGNEVLLKMLQSDYQRIQAKKTAENIETTFNKQKVKNAMLNQVGSELGSEAAEFVERAGVSIQDSRERVAVDE